MLDIMRIVLASFHFYFLIGFALQFKKLRSMTLSFSILCSLAWIGYEFAPNQWAEALRNLALFSHLAILLDFSTNETLRAKNRVLLKLPFFGFLSGYFQVEDIPWLSNAVFLLSFLILVKTAFRLYENHRLLVRNELIFTFLYLVGFIFEKYSWTLVSNFIYLLSFVFWYNSLNLILVGRWIKQRLKF